MRKDEQTQAAELKADEKLKMKRRKISLSLSLDLNVQWRLNDVFEILNLLRVVLI